jgi:hypothetical protein
MEEKYISFCLSLYSFRSSLLVTTNPQSFYSFISNVETVNIVATENDATASADHDVNSVATENDATASADHDVNSVATENDATTSADHDVNIVAATASADHETAIVQEMAGFYCNLPYHQKKHCHYEAYCL